MTCYILKDAFKEYMEPACSNATVRQLGLPYCLPWWFRATASLHRPAPLVAVHAGDKALEAQMAVKVPTLSLLTRERHKRSVNIYTYKHIQIHSYIIISVVDEY